MGNTIGEKNSAVGYNALKQNYNGANNTAVGFEALTSNDTGDRNVAIGSGALRTNTLGSSNVAIGYYAAQHNTTGVANTAIGEYAGVTGSGVSNTTCIGFDAGGVSNVDNRVAIGDIYVTWIGGQVSWSTYSDRRIKTHIQNDVAGLDFIKRLRPVTYNLDIHKMNQMIARGGKGKESPDYPSKYDIEKIKMTGFIAQEVEQAAQEAGYDFSGVQKANDDLGMYSVSYAQFVVPLVKGMQEQQSQIEQLKQENKTLKESLQKMQAQINAMQQQLKK